MRKPKDNMKKTVWTARRLNRLYAHYNRRFWDGRLPDVPVRIAQIKSLAALDWKPREWNPLRITVNVASHRSDRQIRSSLLHEMCHLAAGRPGIHGGHDYKFWNQIEKLLRQRAPIIVSQSEAPGLSILADVVPRRFPLASKAMDKVQRARTRQLENYCRSKGLPESTLITDDQIVQEFKDVAWELTERGAVVAIGRTYGLIDVEAKPTSRWAAQLLARGRRAHARARREYLEDKRRQQQLFGKVTPSGARLAQE